MAEKVDVLDEPNNDGPYPGESEVVVQWPLSYRLTLSAEEQAQLARRSQTQWWHHHWYRNSKDQKPTVLYSRTKARSEEIAQLFLNESVLGFDMEWPWLSESTRLQEKVGLIQIASQSHIGLFRKYHSFEPLPKQMQALFCKGLKPLNVIWHLLPISRATDSKSTLKLKIESDRYWSTCWGEDGRYNRTISSEDHRIFKHRQNWGRYSQCRFLQAAKQLRPQAEGGFRAQSPASPSHIWAAATRSAYDQTCGACDAGAMSSRIAVMERERKEK